MLSLTRVGNVRPTTAWVLSARNQSTRHAFALVLGGGVAGSSVAYHLTKRNIRDVLLLERAGLKFVVISYVDQIQFSKLKFLKVILIFLVLCILRMTVPFRRKVIGWWVLKMGLLCLLVTWLMPVASGLTTLPVYLVASCLLWLLNISMPRSSPSHHLPICRLLSIMTVHFIYEDVETSIYLEGLNLWRKLYFGKIGLRKVYPLVKGSRGISADFSRLNGAYTRACELIPGLKDAELDAKAAVFSMTADGYPLVGPFDKNYWLSTGFLDGVSSGGGIGKYLADWMVDGEPPQELFDTDASRYDRWASREFIVEKSRETYSMYYNWSYTDRLGARPTDRVSGVYGRLRRDKAHFSFRNGWEIYCCNWSNIHFFLKVAQVFDIDEEGLLSTLTREYEMVTNKCGVIDMSWKGKIEVKGPDADAFMNYAIASQVPPLGKIGSGLMLTRQGRVFAPLKIFHHDDARSAFIVLTEPERESRDLYWLECLWIFKSFEIITSIFSFLKNLKILFQRIGQITSGSYSVRLQRPIAFAWIGSDVKSDEKLTVDIGLDKRLTANILENLPHRPIQLEIMSRRRKSIGNFRCRGMATDRTISIYNDEPVPPIISFRRNLEQFQFNIACLEKKYARMEREGRHTGIEVKKY
uniref:DAO domain-containing protein n=1 Tax=Heterorhabditis bacteriophora TaxID=37862 RepID=A0A1I7WRY2_HETBA